ncbi:DUF1194 domain-containing protein [Sphingomonas panacisoli]|uniref:DUF1194 domain-containing protein n=1 Tax=Sphingomonas panacisoli TaxID=1813879 RepID=A0A5B8LEJ5_9SPHN|nr:DUF1194 domain-containing protein [Sphingomonas panacisoli]QDZ06491.1 DUF1194 domain-containing protein [Sphingomonas panacisoli]
MNYRVVSAALLGMGMMMAPSVAQAQAAPTNVDIELALLIDVSGSVDTTEFNLQRQGYVNAFNDSAIQAVFASGKSAAITVVYWSGQAEQSQAVGWTLVNSAASASAFANLIAATSRPFSGSTAIGSAINYIAPKFFTNAFNGTRQVIDVSGDGATNEGADTLTARNAALALGVDQINGLPILGESGLLAFYQNNVQGGAGSFTQPAATFADFDAAIKAKIGRELVGGVPEPTTWAMMVMGFGAVGFSLRRRNKVAMRVRFA